MKYILFYLVIALSAKADWDVLLYSDSNNPEGIPGGWPAQVQPVAQDDPVRGAPWIRMTDEELATQKANNNAAYEAWRDLRESKEKNTPAISQEMTRRLAGGAWEGALRANMLDFELMGLSIRLQLLTTELLGLVTKAVAGTVATNNLTAPERARVGSLRTQLSFPQQADFTQSDRDRAVFIKGELTKVYNLWMKARELREKVRTNATPVDLSSEIWPDTTLGE